MVAKLKPYDIANEALYQTGQQEKRECKIPYTDHHTSPAVDVRHTCLIISGRYYDVSRILIRSQHSTRMRQAYSPSSYRDVDFTFSFSC